MKHYTLVQSIKIWRSVRVGSRPMVRQKKAKKAGSGRFGNAKGRSITTPGAPSPRGIKEPHPFMTYDFAFFSFSSLKNKNDTTLSTPLKK